MAATITEISVRGFKSIERVERLPLTSVNVLVGANGAGKSNFIALLNTLRCVADRQMQIAVQMSGGADLLLYLGPRATRELAVELSTAGMRYEAAWAPSVDNRLIFTRETATHGTFRASLSPGTTNEPAESTLFHFLKPELSSGTTSFVFAHPIHAALGQITAYHFEDTSATAGVRRWGGLNDDERLRPDASNLAAFLHRIRVTHPDHLKQIRDVVRLAAPFFDDFKLRPIPTNPDQIQLEWTQAGTDYPFRPSQLSDGTLRFICLATALLQPDPPAVMMFDEPELGLHPYALTLLAALFRQTAAGPSQIIVSTQSATLLNEFDAEDVIVVERANGASTFRRLDPAALSEWLADYALGDLWQKNVFGGRPAPEPGGLP